MTVASEWIPLVGGLEPYLKPLGKTLPPLGRWRYGSCFPLSLKFGAAGSSSTVQPSARSFSVALVAASLLPPSTSRTNARIAAAITSADPTRAAIIVRLARGSRRSLRTFGGWTGRFGGGGVRAFLANAGRWQLRSSPTSPILREPQTKEARL